MADDHHVDEAAVELGAVLAALYRRIRQTKELGELSGPESSALSRLAHHGTMTAAELSKLEQISPQSIAATLQGLLGKGLVERRADPGDGRRLILSLTAAGHETIAHRRGARAEQLDQALARLEPAERARLIAALPALAQLAQEL